VHTGSAVELRHVLDARQFERPWLENELFPLAERLERTPRTDLAPVLEGRRLFYLLYEPSTRTRVSFETAAELLGATVSGMDSHEHRAEDERIEDRIRVLNEYGYDFILVRHHEEGGAARAAAVSRAPVINAGDGGGQHPTQALLDVYTLRREFGRLDGLRIAIVGDLSYQRSTNSLAFLLSTLRDLDVFLVSPELLRMRADVRDHLRASGARVHEAGDLREIAAKVDVVYMTRAYSYRLEHAERFDGRPGAYVVDRGVLDLLPAHARVLHPLPRGLELADDLDADPRVACFRQARNGLFVRMALLQLLARTTPVMG
jgi:aspartate carbamoyltransferase catalytic subunit